MVYEWKTNYYKVDAEVAGKVFEELDSTVGLSAQTLVEASRDESAPLHNEFEWENDVAGELWREHQARQMICNLTIQVETEDKEPVSVRAYMALDDRVEAGAAKEDNNAISRRSNRRYESIKTVFESEEKTNYLLKLAMRELISFERKYATLEELKGVFGEIEKLKEAAHKNKH